MTLHTTHQCGYLANNNAFVTSTCYGDGAYLVLMHPDKLGITIDTGFSEDSGAHNDNATSWVQEPLVCDGTLVVIDPCYTDINLGVSFNMAPGNYAVGLGWPSADRVGKERHSFVFLRKIA